MNIHNYSLTVITGKFKKLKDSQHKKAKEKRKLTKKETFPFLLTNKNSYSVG